MANSNLAGLRPQFPDTDFTLVVGSGGSTTIATNLYYWVNGYSRGGMNLLTSLGQKSVSVGQKLTWTVTTKAPGDDVFAWILSASTTNDATQAKVLCLARAKGEDQLTVDDPPIAVQLTHDGHFSLGSIVGSLPTTNLLDGMIRYQDNAYRQYNTQALAWEVVNGWDTYLSSTLSSLSPGVYKGGCDVPILSNESIIPLPAYEGGTTPFLRLSILNGLNEGSGVILPTGTKLSLSARVNGSDEIGGNYLSGRIEIVPVQKTRRSNGTVTALSGGTITWVYGTPFYTLTSDLERGYALEFDVRVVDALLPEGFNFTFFISEYGTLSAPIAANASGTLIYGTGGRLRLVPALTGAFRLSGSGVIDVDGETVSYPINAPGKQQYSFGLQSDTADQVAAISGIGNGSIEFKANVNALLSTEAVRAIVSTEAITAAPSSWVSVGSVSANQSISLTVNYPCDTDGLGTIRADYPDVIANSTEGEFNPDRLRLFLRRNGSIITETSPVNVTPGESQTLIITLVGSTATLPTDPGEDYNFWDYGTITPSVSVTTSNLPAGTYEVAIAYDYLGDKIVKISHSQADGAIPELSATLADTSNLASAYSDIYNQSGVLQSKVTELQFKDGLSVVKSGDRLIVTPDSQTHIRTTNPTTSNDSSQGYVVGDKWLNTVVKQEYTLVSAAIGAADWQKVNSEISYNDLTDLPTLGTAAALDVNEPNGVCGLDGSGKVSSTYLPSYVDDVLEYANLAGFPVTGETGKIYVALDNNKVYRWSGSVYVEISNPFSGSYNDLTDKPTIPTTAAEITVDTTNLNVNLSGTDNTVQKAIETLDELVAGGGGHTIQDEGTPLTQRTNLNFVGTGVTATDSAGTDTTTVTVNLPSTGSGLNLGAWDSSGTFTSGVRFDGSGDKVILPAANTATRSASTPLQGELVYDTDLDKFFYGDGVTVGGVEVGSGSGGGREVLTANRTYYVRTDGSDSNTGLTNTSGGAFLTIQKAIDIVASLDISIYDVTIKIGNGTYTSSNILKSPIGSGLITIQGDITTPNNVIISTIDSCFTCNSSCNYKIEGLRLTATTGHAITLASPTSLVSINAIDFHTVAYSHISCVNGSVLSAAGNYSITGGTGHAHWYVVGTAAVSVIGKTITITGTPTFVAAFAWSDRGFGYFDVWGNTFSGSAIGARYNLNRNAVCFVAGASTNYLPGNAAGTTTAGAQYG